MIVRFAPSPTGPLHIGGVRTALYNYLLAKKNGGTFILRIEDTDQKRFVSGAEEYIINTLKWLGLEPDEGPDRQGDFGPYRQSERKELYHSEIQKLLDTGRAYLAFDTATELEQMRASQKELGVHTPKYDHTIRHTMRNSLSMTDREVKTALDQNTPYVIRLKIEPNQTVIVRDVIRGEVHFDSSELDDKILIKSDGMPTYHLANIIDDHHMQISHVIRGEEWLSSTAHHVLLYQAFGWEDTMPVFAHLPLILKPTGKGKLSKRDGSKLGIPVFPLSWKGEAEQDSFEGFREYGFLPRAVINFLALLGWNPGVEQEIFSLEQLIELFDIEQIGKSGARFDFEKAKWFNQHYIAELMDSELAKLLKPILLEAGIRLKDDKIFDLADMMKDRLETLQQIIPKTTFLFEPPMDYDQKQLRKKWKENSSEILSALIDQLKTLPFEDPETLQTQVKKWIEDRQISFGQIMPLMRLAICGKMQGPDLFVILHFIGKSQSIERLENALETFPKLLQT